MHSLKRAIAVGTATFGASVVGMLLQFVVPTQILTDAKGAVGAMVGLVTLLLALVLGLLIWTAFSVYTTQQAEALSLGPVVVELDVALELYGPQAALGRQRVREAVARSRARFFGDWRRIPPAWTFEESRATISGMTGYFDSLQPSTEAQQRLLGSARDLAKKFADTQMLMARQLVNPLPPFLLIVVVLWSCALFLGNGLVASLNAVTVVAHLAGGIAIASAIFLILELSQPYTGVIRLSSAGIDRLIQLLAEVKAPA